MDKISQNSLIATINDDIRKDNPLFFPLPIKLSIDSHQALIYQKKKAQKVHQMLNLM